MKGGGVWPCLPLTASADLFGLDTNYQNKRLTLLKLLTQNYRQLVVTIAYCIRILKHAGFSNQATHQIISFYVLLLSCLLSW